MATDSLETVKTSQPAVVLGSDRPTSRALPIKGNTNSEIHDKIPTIT